MRKRERWMRACRVGLLVGLLLGLAGCDVPRPGLEVSTPRPAAVLRTPGTPGTPAPLPSPLPTPCAGARVTGKVCMAGVDVTLSTCCPEWQAITTSDSGGAFAFEALTVGTFTVTAGQRSRRVTLRYCDSQVDVDLCPGP